MCGLTGILSTDGRGSDLSHRVEQMTERLRHRGPDSGGLWADPSGTIALGHRRLAILDLSAKGHQPMASASGRYTVSYNGEIYNFRLLRKDLESAGATFSGHSDTEVLLAALERWGIAGALERLNGMFAFALWDAERRELHLARDRTGEKPLYYTWLGGELVFVSELTALRRLPDFAGEVDRQAVALLMRHGFIPAPYSIYTGVHKLPAAHVLTVRADASAKDAKPRPYWSMREVALAATNDPFDASEAEIVDQLDLLLADSVRMRLESDVALGSFLSGGVDSSLVTALANNALGRPISTFTVGMDDPRLNEADQARAVASHLGTDHHEVMCSAGDALALVSRMTQIYDEPFADPSQLPTTLISEVARRQVTVCLSGDGGDEVFAGYNRYVLGGKAWAGMRRVPRPLRLAGSKLLLSAGPATWDRAVERYLARMLPVNSRQRGYGTKAHKLAQLLPARSPEEVYLRLISQWDSPVEAVLGAVEPLTGATDTAGWPRLGDPIAQMQFADSLVTLPDDMLVKVDRASMAVGLETRLPLLDHRVVEFAWRVPMSMRIKDGRGKHILRQVLHRYVPPELVDRPKIGFDPPLGEWLRGPLRPWAEELLDPRRLVDQGYLNAALIQSRWREHLTGRRNWDYALWTVLMFQDWLAHAKTEISA